jgi:dipeptidyl aminopeptidase/acylaminoacyl peptidase
VIWSSERSGWRHLELIDVASGTLVRTLTAGDWAVRDVLGVDHDWVWFTACGREPGRDPYFRHVYRAPVAGGEPELLTPEDADHSCVLSPSGGYLLDTASTVDTAPVTRMRSADGTGVMDVVTADLGALHVDGWIPPERFSATAADGVTPLYGVIYRPVDFDPARRYSVIDAYYPGPQLIRTPKSFTVDDSSGVDAWPGPWGAQALAELGFVVVTVDGHGTPLRGRAMHHATYGRLEDNALDDHIAAIRSLAATRPWMDLSAGVGAQGHSAGAAATVRALLTHPEFFTVGVAGSGVHDLRRYVAYWGEKYQGLPDRADYSHQSNLDLADRLEGRLLLLHGELDDNVHPSNTLALYDAFVRAERDVDLVLLAGWGHPCWTHPYYVRRMWDFFVRHLMGAEPPKGYRVTSAAGPGGVLP